MYGLNFVNLVYVLLRIITNCSISFTDFAVVSPLFFIGDPFPPLPNVPLCAMPKSIFGRT